MCIVYLHNIYAMSPGSLPGVWRSPSPGRLLTIPEKDYFRRQSFQPVLQKFGSDEERGDESQTDDVWR